MLILYLYTGHNIVADITKEFAEPLPVPELLAVDAQDFPDINPDSFQQPVCLLLPDNDEALEDKELDNLLLDMDEAEKDGLAQASGYLAKKSKLEKVSKKSVDITDQDGDEFVKSRWLDFRDHEDVNIPTHEFTRDVGNMELTFQHFHAVN